MSEILRTVKLTDEQADRIFSVLECAEATFLARVMQEFLARNTLERRRAWSEVRRIAQVDPLTEECYVSYATSEIVVKKKSEKREDSNIWEVVEDE